jgi:hypothetical protein
MLLGRLALAEAPVERAETKVTVGGERPHPELVGPRESLTVVCLSGLHVRRIGVRGDLAEEAEGPRLMAAFPSLARVPRRCKA